MKNLVNNEDLTELFKDDEYDECKELESLSVEDETNIYDLDNRYYDSMKEVDVDDDYLGETEIFDIGNTKLKIEIQPSENEQKTKRGRPKGSLNKNKVNEVVEEISGISILNTDKYNHNEFGKYEYKYYNIKDPEEKPTQYYKIFYKMKDGTDWFTSSRLVSKHFKITSLENYIRELKEEMVIGKEQINSNTPFILQWSGETQYKIEAFNRDSERKLFSMITGIDDNMDILSKIYILVANGYNGSRSMMMNFNIKISAKNNEGERVEYVDYFILSKLKQKIIHSGTIKKIKSSLEKVDEVVNKNIEMYKNYNLQTYNVEDSFIPKIESCFSFKDVKSTFYSLWSSMPTGYKTLYNLILITSRCLDMEYSLNTHYKIEPIMIRLFNMAEIEYKKIGK